MGSVLKLIFLLFMGCSEPWAEESCYVLPPAAASSAECDAVAADWSVQFLANALAQPLPLTHGIEEVPALPPPPIKNAANRPGTEHRKASPSSNATAKTNTSGAAANTNCVDINHGDVNALMKLPGIGQSRARAIEEAREKRPFKRKADIQRVKGIGKQSYKKMADFICDI
ncbi:MAG: helix-hairpin-helix domain-containing protein [Proteobacteria bacterium]|nr:helix-hairpin-helix domain-containing protein [Pseudomonadota bacterium]